MSLKFSVHSTDAGTHFAAAEVRLRSIPRLKMWVSSTPGSFELASTRATELPTVPKPSSAIFTGAAAFFFLFAATGWAFAEAVAIFVSELLRFVVI